MQAKVWSLAFSFLCSHHAQASDFPVKHAGDAIRIAKKVCGDPQGSRIKWDAKLDRAKATWEVNTNAKHLHKSYQTSVGR